jgi:hypothetical protein
MGYESDILYFTSVKDGDNGADGADGITPHIQDGYWYIGDEP